MCQSKRIQKVWIRLEAFGEWTLPHGTETGTWGLLEADPEVFETVLLMPGCQSLHQDAFREGGPV
jgi:hypothetical protein